jgi:hypothetical protein
LKPWCRCAPFLAAPEEAVLVGSDGKEALWVDRMADLPAEPVQLIEEDLAVREFVPTIERIRKCRVFPPQHLGSGDRSGSAQMVLKAEEDIRKLAGRTRLLISGSDGVQYRIPDTTQLDKHSRKLLERFL